MLSLFSSGSKSILNNTAIKFNLLNINDKLVRNFSSTNSDSSEKKIKHKVPQKRASSLLNTLKNEEFERLKNGRQWPLILAGDSVVIERLPYMSSNEVSTIKGIVISNVNRASDSSITILNVEYGTPIERRIILYNPLIQSIKVLQRAFLHKGKKRVRRSKLYYLKTRDPDQFTVK